MPAACVPLEVGGAVVVIVVVTIALALAGGDE
jgi:hypothetical protein